MTVLETARLTLRPWRDADLAPFAALNADPQVMRHFPGPLTREQSDAFAGRVRRTFDDQGWGLWAVEVRAEVPFIGYVGLARPAFEAHFTPAVEIGWRLAHPCWGRGYAPEAARAVLDFGFEVIGLAEIVSFTTVGNQNSRKVMDKLGLSHDERDDFNHPNLALDDPLRRHVLYRRAAPRGSTPGH